ncbi:MAG: hypothetical protein AAF483_18700 [Planctomycetota bacterium]
MQDYSISKCTRKCAVAGRALEPGEDYVSAIMADGDEVKRIDIAAREWKGPGEETIGWWRAKMPAAQQRKLRPAPNGVLLDTLSELLERPDQEELAYFLALLLVRRRVLSEEPTLEENSEAWTLVCNADDRSWNVPVHQPEAERIAEIRESLNNLLFTEE